MTETSTGLVARLQRRWAMLQLQLIQRFSLAAYHVSGFRHRHAGKLELLIWAAIIGVGILVLPLLRTSLDTLIDHAGVDAIRDLLKTVGSAMIGATAIAASFILFALQVNVERLPHGLFRRFSSDGRLLASVAASLLLAIGGTALTLISADRYVALAILLGVLILALILRLLLYAYRRSLTLINPAEQLRLLRSGVSRGLDRWDKRVTMLASLVELSERDGDQGARENAHDLRRAVVLRANPDWANDVKNGVRQAAAYARRAGESGDLEISAIALNTLVRLNAAYLKAKGRTFFAQQLLIDNPLVTDGVINETLESLKRLRGVASARSDELQLEQVFAALVALVRLYATIEYGGPHDNKSHALLAAGYLESAVEAVLPSGLTDTIMNGAQALGAAANHFLAISKPQEAVGLIRKLGLLGGIGLLKTDHKPVTLTVIEQLRDITLNLVRLQDASPRFALGEMRETVTMIAQAFLHTPDKHMGGHSFYLAPYYSGTSMTGLQVKLGEMANALIELPADSARAQRIIDNIAAWADGLFEPQKQLLLMAAERRSPFFFDIAHWIAAIAEVLLVTAAAPAARDNIRDELRKHARWLIGTLSWLPTDADTARFVENWSHRDNVARLALRCRQLGELECLRSAEQTMLNWALAAGAHHTGWGTLGQWLLALAGLAVSGGVGLTGDGLKARLADELVKAQAPNQEMRDRAARDLREAAQDIRRQEFEIDLAKRLLASGEPEIVRALLIELAAILSPDTVNEPVRPAF